MDDSDARKSALRWGSVVFIIANVISSLIEKIIYNTYSYGSKQYGYHAFNKPIFYSVICTIGSMSSLLVYHMGTLCNCKVAGPSNEKPLPNYFKFLIPGILDLFQTVVSSLTVIFAGISIEYMMRCGTVVGVALISRIFFKKKYKPFESFSIGLTLLSLLTIGFAGIIDSGRDSIRYLSKGWMAVLMVVKFISQIGYAIKLCFEQYFTHNLGLNSTLIAGLEGTWSFIFGIFLVLPASEFAPGVDGNSIHEDLVDTTVMISNNWEIAIFCVAAVLSDVPYGVCSTFLTANSSAIVRTFIELIGAFFVWAIQLVIYYAFNGNSEYSSFSKVGEDWSRGSWIELVGYITLVVGLLQYEGFPHLPCFSYSADEISPSKKVPLVENEPTDQVITPA